GCSASCTLEDGYYCDTPGSPCAPTTCGNGTVEGTEQCDDGNLIPFDGCTASCTNEPSCSGGTCVAVCGDGVILPGGTEECDDGNTIAGDGCSPSCTTEAGFTCTLTTPPAPSQIELPLIVRDFKGDDVAGGHIDFENGGGNEITYGIVKNNLQNGV